MERVRLIRKLAPLLNGVDLSRSEVGDYLTVPDKVATMLVKEGWAERVTADADDKLTANRQQ